MEKDELIKSWLQTQIENLEHGFFATAELFVSNCAACHNRNMKDDLTGPALAGVRERWSDYPKDELYRFIRKSQEMIWEGHPQAVAVWNEWKPVVMNNFSELSDREIEALLDDVDWVAGR